MFTLLRDLTQPPHFTDDTTPSSEEQGSVQGHHASWRQMTQPCLAGLGVGGRLFLPSHIMLLEGIPVITSAQLLHFGKNISNIYLFPFLS